MTGAPPHGSAPRLLETPRRWWSEQVVDPLDRLYDELDEHQRELDDR